MKKIMFNDKYGLTQAVLEGRKTQTRRMVGITLTPLYNVGEEVAIAQPYRAINSSVYLVNKAGWTNKMFVRAELMPNRIRITNRRVERLQNISDEDCMREGITSFKNKHGVDVYSIGNGLCFSSARLAYAALIDTLYGKQTWDDNPYVFVYDFELIR